MLGFIHSSTLLFFEGFVNRRYIIAAAPAEKAMIAAVSVSMSVSPSGARLGESWGDERLVLLCWALLSVVIEEECEKDEEEARVRFDDLGRDALWMGWLTAVEEAEAIAFCACLPRDELSELWLTVRAEDEVTRMA